MEGRSRDSKGRFVEREILIEPTKDWGYFCGLVLGDGTVYEAKTKNYRIAIESTKKELVESFREVAKAIGLNPTNIHTRNKTRVFPNGSKREDIQYSSCVSCKQVYKLLRSCKLPNYKFVIPKFVFENDEALSGFLQGFFDAEGGVLNDKKRNHTRIYAYSKHSSNLEQIKEALHKIGIHSTIYQQDHEAGVYIISHLDRMQFAKKVGFRLESKRAKLSNMSKPANVHYNKNTKEKVMLLKAKGKNYNEISKMLRVRKDIVKDWLEQSSAKGIQKHLDSYCC